MNKFSKYIIFLLVTFSFLFSLQAGTIKKIFKGRKAQISLQGTKLKKGKTYKVHNRRGKKIGSIYIYKVKGRYAFGKFKGKVKKGYKVKAGTFKRASRKKSRKSRRSRKTKESNQDSSMIMGALVGSSINTLTISNTDFTGNSIAAQGYLDYPLLGYLNVRGAIGYQPLSGKSTLNEVDITYLSAGATVSFIKSVGNFRPWIGGNFFFLVPVAFSENTKLVLNESDIATTSSFGVSAGFDWHAGSIVIPVQLDYSQFPGTDAVSTSTINFRVGFGKKF